MIVLSLVVLAALGIFVVVHDTWYTRLNPVKMVSSKVSDRGLRVLQISDFHSLARDAQIDKIINLAAAAKPDLIAFTGDLVATKDTKYTQIERLFAGLARTHKNIFIVWGNHDHWNAEYTGSWRLAELAAKYRIVVLTNSSQPLDGPWGSLDVIGTDDYYTKRGDLRAALVGTRPDAFRLVLTHAPEIIKDLRRSKVDLAICGHTHGGQIRIPFIGALYVPGHLFPKYDDGWYMITSRSSQGGVPLYIDSGVGTSVVDIRAFNPSQITLYEISKG